MVERGQGISRGLTRAAVVDAALAIVDERGLAALSMRAVAAGLGVEAMSLYHHVRNKEDLLDALIARLVAVRPAAQPDPLSSRDRLREMALAFRAALHEHPEVARLFATRPTGGPAWADGVESTLQAFGQAGLDAAAAARAYRVYWAYVTGYVLREVRQQGAVPLRDQLADLPAADYPLTRALPDLLNQNDDGEEFLAGLDIVLAGLL
jgi:AcrR family transcriptional regulator